MNDSIAQDGTMEGEAIPGSKYVRAFCNDCNKPVRVTPEQLTAESGTYCTGCDGPNGIVGVPRSEKSLNTIDADPDMFGILKY